MSTSTRINRRSFIKYTGIASIGSTQFGTVSRNKTPRITEQRNFIVYRNDHAYSAWPTILRVQSGDLLIAFNEGWRRVPKYTHMDPSFHGMIIRSEDDGQSWSRFPTPIGGYEEKSMDAVGITKLKNGVILAHGLRYQYFTLEEAKRRSDVAFESVRTNTHLREQGFPWRMWVSDKMTYVYRSVDEGRTWEKGISADISPYRAAFPLRSGVELDDGSILIPCAEDMFDTMRAFIIRSEDGGHRFGDAVSLAEDKDIWFTEPALLLLPSGKLLALIRTHEEGEGYLYQCESSGGGKTWSKPVRTPMWGYPAHMLLLRDEVILCVRGHRREPYGIRATLSYDGGRSWDIENDLAIRADFKNANLGYPTSVQLPNGNILTVYYGEDSTGVTCIQGSSYRLEY